MQLLKVRNKFEEKSVRLAPISEILTGTTKKNGRVAFDRIACDRKVVVAYDRPVGEEGAVIHQI